MSSPHWNYSFPSNLKPVAQSAKAALPLSYFHPTSAMLSKTDDTQVRWSSREHRKHRFRGGSTFGRKAESFFQKVGHMARVEYWNISWWVAIAFTLGSISWVVNGFAAFLPFCNSHFQKAETSMGWTAWLGATIFEIGSIFGMLEAWNRDDTANFSQGVRRAMRRPNKLKDGDRAELNQGEEGSETTEQGEQQKEEHEQYWIWWSRNSKYWHEIGFLAAFAQLCGATIFWISGFTALPQIQTAMSPGLTDGVFWTPQVVGASGFVVSSVFMMLEVQNKWYKPEPLSLGWQVGFWNFIGATGFLLCGALGYGSTSNSKLAYQSALSTFWGAWAFLIGSVIQWYESVNSV